MIWQRYIGLRQGLASLVVLWLMTVTKTKNITESIFPALLREVIEAVSICQHASGITVSPQQRI